MVGGIHNVDVTNEDVEALNRLADQVNRRAWVTLGITAATWVKFNLRSRSVNFERQFQSLSLDLTSVMAALYGHDTHYDSMAPKEETLHADDINRIKKELDLLKVAVRMLSHQNST